MKNLVEYLSKHDRSKAAIKWLLRAYFGSIPNSVKHVQFLLLFKTFGTPVREGLIAGSDTVVMVGSPNPDRVHQLASLTGADGFVLFVEPEPTNVASLREAAHEYEFVEIDDRGAWSESGTQELLLADSANPGDHKVPLDGIEHDNDYRSGNYRDSITIDVAELDRILADHGIQPDYVEIMVNGAELEVLRGATDTLANASPTVVVKGHARETTTNSPINGRIVEFLDEFGYTSVIGAGGDSTVGRTGSWEVRDGDVYAWK